jgi:hypothetical protein
MFWIGVFGGRWEGARIFGGAVLRGGLDEV